MQNNYLSPSVAYSPKLGNINPPPRPLHRSTALIEIRRASRIGDDQDTIDIDARHFKSYRLSQNYSISSGVVKTKPSLKLHSNKTFRTPPTPQQAPNPTSTAIMSIPNEALQKVC